MLGQIESELAPQEVDRFGPRECELGRRDVEDRSRHPPPREAGELRRPSRGEDEVGVVGEHFGELVAE